MGFMHTHKNIRMRKPFLTQTFDCLSKCLRQRVVERAYIFHKIDWEDSTCNELSKNSQAAINLISEGGVRESEPSD